MSGFHCRLPCVVSDLKANAYLVLLTLMQILNTSNAWHTYQNGRVTSKQNFQRVGPLYICGSCYAGKSRLRSRISQKVSVVVNFENSNSLVCLWVFFKKVKKLYFTQYLTAILIFLWPEISCKLICQLQVSFISEFLLFMLPLFIFPLW